MKDGRQRRRYTAAQKVAIVLEGLRGDTEIAAVCRRHGISTSQFFDWRKRLLAGGKEALARPQGSRKSVGEVARLQDDVARKYAVIAEMAEEIVKVKKGLWPLRSTRAGRWRSGVTWRR